ncbi:MAG: C40 family peptidase [Lachnospiraceae bacterium]|nr:C40 family peptidase [Lachnospiraceae bacterium]
MKMKKVKSLTKIISFTAAFAAAFTCVFALPQKVHATTLDNLENQKEGLIDNKQNVQNDINSTTSKIASTIAEIDILEADINTMEGQIEQAKIDIQAAEEAAQRQYQQMKIRMKFIYENGNKSILELFAESKSFGDFLNRIEYTDAVYASDREMLTSYEATKIDITGMKEGLEEEKTTLEAKKKELSAKEESLNSTLAALKISRDEINKKIANVDKQIADEKERLRKIAEEEEKRRRAAAAEAERIRKAQEEAARQARQNQGSGGSSSGGTSSKGIDPAQRTNISGEAVIEYARQFVGNPYVWGGNSLTQGCDCSGFIVQVYKHFGIDLSGSRNSYAMRSIGQEVSYDSMKAGDIICYQGHVALYMSNGHIVEAQGKNQGITDYRLPTSHTILTIRRII